MKKYLLYAVLGILAVAGSSFVISNALNLNGRSAYIYNVPSGSVTNTEKDTISIPANFLTNYQFQAGLIGTQVSGTYNVRLYLDENNTLTGSSGWRVIDSTTTTTAKTVWIRQSVLYGLRYRFRVSGTTGTQVSTYLISVTAKPI